MNMKTQDYEFFANKKCHFIRQSTFSYDASPPLHEEQTGTWYIKADDSVPNGVDIGKLFLSDPDYSLNYQIKAYNLSSDRQLLRLCDSNGDTKDFMRLP